MKQWVVKPSRYEPKFNDLIEQWGNHYHIALSVARVRKPRDKPSVEKAVSDIYKRVYAPLRNERLTSLKALNHAIKEQLDKHHLEKFQGRSYSRKERFEKQEKPLLSAPPPKKYVVKHYTSAKIQSNYHVFVGEDKHYYSVPYRYIGSRVNIIYCTEYVEVYLNGERIALHSRSFQSHAYTTLPDHMPPNHQRMWQPNLWNPEIYLEKAQEYGPCTHAFFKKVMEKKSILDQSYQSCQGLLRIAKAHPERIEDACRRAMRGSSFNYKTIRNIIENKMDLLEDKFKNEPVHQIPSHSNIRGSKQYN